jgi:sulfur carrier protein ThiS
MVVYLKAGSELRERLNPDHDHYTRRVEVPEGTRVKEILEDIGLNPAFVAFVYAGGKVRGFDYIPRDGETITLQSPVSGG